MEETCKLYKAGWPAVTLAKVEPLVVPAREKSVALPDRATARGLPAALSVIASEPFRVPLTVGANVTLKAQLVPEATVLPQVLDWEKSPVIATFVILSGASPVLFSVTGWAVLVVPAS